MPYGKYAKPFGGFGLIAPGFAAYALPGWAGFSKYAKPFFYGW